MAGKAFSPPNWRADFPWKE